MGFETSSRPSRARMPTSAFVMLFAIDHDRNATSGPAPAA
jgi:hypothetical protein